MAAKIPLTHQGFVQCKDHIFARTVMNCLQTGKCTSRITFLWQTVLLRIELQPFFG